MFMITRIILSVSFALHFNVFIFVFHFILVHFFLILKMFLFFLYKVAFYYFYVSEGTLVQKRIHSIATEKDDVILIQITDGNVQDFM